MLGWAWNQGQDHSLAPIYQNACNMGNSIRYIPCASVWMLSYQWSNCVGFDLGHFGIKDFENQDISTLRVVKPTVTVTVRSIFMCIRCLKCPAAQSPKLRIAFVYRRCRNEFRACTGCAELGNQTSSLAANNTLPEAVSVSKTIQTTTKGNGGAWGRSDCWTGPSFDLRSVVSYLQRLFQITG